MPVHTIPSHQLARRAAMARCLAARRPGRGPAAPSLVLEVAAVGAMLVLFMAAAILA